MNSSFILCLLVSFLDILALSSGIMVTFGTKQGPIIPRATKQVPLTSRSSDLSNPAPVSERADDLPNPNVYRPLVPHQYRSKLYSYRPSPNLILGTPLDIKYTPSLIKYNDYKKSQARSLGIDYTGPNVFERQEYEFLDLKKHKTTLQPSVRYIKPEYYANKNANARYVPQIGIVYSAGIRYYVPQMYNKFYPQRQEESAQQEEQENSVYDRNDQKFFYRN